VAAIEVGEIQPVVDRTLPIQKPRGAPSGGSPASRWQVVLTI